MTFEDWYEEYERDGGELMLYNSIDLYAAFSAGRNDGIAGSCSENARLREALTKILNQSVYNNPKYDTYEQHLARVALGVKSAKTL